MSDELKIVLEDVKEKFDTVIESFNMVTNDSTVTKRPKKNDFKGWIRNS